MTQGLVPTYFAPDGVDADPLPSGGRFFLPMTTLAPTRCEGGRP